jgi:cell division protein FtsB
MSDKLPDNGGYVAAAYLVFLALVLIYVAIMAIRVAKVERDLAELHQQLDADEATRPQERASA